MNVLLAYPEAREVFFNLKHTLRVLGKKALLPPVGLLTAGALLPEEWNKQFIDLHVRDVGDEELAWADYVFISLTAGCVQDASALELLDRCRVAGVKVVAGGPGFYPEPTAFAKQRETFWQVDHFVLDEAELTLPVFLRDLRAGKAERVYRNAERANIADSPIPLWDLLDLGDYAQMAIQLTRGCPFHCDFCLVPALMGRPGRTKSSGQFLQELDRIYALGWRGFVEINDDNLIADLKFAKHELLPALAAWQRTYGMPFRFHVCVDSRVGEDPELLRALWEAGFHSVFLGIENLNPKSLAEVHKTVNRNKDMLEIVRTIHRAGIFAYSGMMVGFDHDDDSVFQSVVDFTDRCGLVMPSLTKVNALPGTKLHARLLEAGRINDVTPGVAHKSNVSGLPMGDQVRDDGYRDLMLQLWEPERFYARVKTALMEFPTDVHTQKPRVEDLAVLARIVVRVGVVGRERREFWRLVSWALRDRPELLGAVLSVAPLGHGFRKRSEEVFAPQRLGRLRAWFETLKGAPTRRKGRKHVELHAKAGRGRRDVRSLVVRQQAG